MSAINPLRKKSLHHDKVSYRAMGLAAAALLASSGLANAQSEDVRSAGEDGAESSLESDRNLETVFVTARKQSETLQETPLTVSVIGGEYLERFQNSNIEDITSRIPTLNVQVGGTGSGGQISLRGVGSSNISAAFDSAVAFDFDGVQVSTMRIVQSSFFDTAQIEVLKGPQSLFFGKSASAGVLSVKSRNPTDEFEAGGKASYEFEEEGTTFEGYVSGPLSDTFGYRFAARVNEVQKLYENSAPVAHPERGETNVNLRGTLQWEPASNFSATLKANYVGYENDGGARNAVIYCGANGVPDDIVVLGGSVVIDPGYNCDIGGDSFFLPDQAAPMAIQAPAGNAGNNNGIPYSDSDIYFGVLDLEWELSDLLTLTSTTGYFDQSAVDFDNYSYGGIVDGESYGIGSAVSTNEVEQFTQELRLSSDHSGPLNFMLGAFYEHRDIAFVASQAGGQIGLVAPDPVTGNTFGWLKGHYTDAEAYSVFGNLDFDLTERVSLSTGVRWSEEEKINTIHVPYVHAFLSGGGSFIGSGFESGDIRFSDSNWSPEVSLTWRATDDINLYAAYKTGFKSGGIDNSALPSNGLTGFASADPDVRAAAGAALIFDSETSQGFEAGMKSQIFDRALTLNVSAYNYVFEDLQVQTFDAVNVQFNTANAGEVTTRGLEADFNWIGPVQGLTVFGSLAYTNSEFSTPFDPDPNDADDVDLEGRATANAPEWSGNLAADLAVPVASNLEFRLTPNVSFSSSYYTDESSFEDYKQPSYTTFDLSASLGRTDDAWKLALIAKNLSDERYVNSSSPRPFLTTTGDDSVFNLNRGRQVFVEVSARY